MYSDIEKVRKKLEKQHYSLVGETSAVQICRWTKNSLNGKGVCWKEKFYGIKSHRCCQFSPSVMWCENKCLHCWRPIEMNLGTKLPCVDEPNKIIDGVIEARKKLLMGFKGNKKISAKKFEEACNPNMFTFSLSGEPTIYPRLGEIISELRKRNCITFLVTNGLNSEAIEKLEKENCLPTQLTLSTNAPNKKLFELWHRSTKKNAWEEFNKTILLMKKLNGKCRRVVRLTLVKKGKDKGKYKDVSNMEDEHVSEYVSLIKKAEPDFVHVKGFMSVGYARERMGYDKMPWHYEVRAFAEKLILELKKEGYNILGEEKRSCVVLIGKNKKDLNIKKA